MKRQIMLACSWGWRGGAVEGEHRSAVNWRQRAGAAGPGLDPV
jgi:hypothetical protein